MNRLLFAFALTVCTIVCQAQTRWINPFDEGGEVHGQGWGELRSGSYVRFPDKAHGVVREDVWGLSRNAAGLSFVFRSNAETISVRYQVEGALNMFHMPSTGVSGVDLYATDVEGGIRWCAPNFTPSFMDTINYVYSGLTYYPEGAGYYDYQLYLPLYNNVKWLEIGVPEGAEITFYKESEEKPIVVYGTSIAQGACASRPGLAWSNIVSRELKMPLVNLAFSGNGKMEPEVFELLAEIDARMYVIDCLPNLNGSTEIVSRALAGVKILREKHDCPILFVEHSGYTQEFAQHKRASYRETNAELHKAYETILAAGYKNIWYMTHEELNMDLDCMVEGAHPNDIGMRHHADGYERKISEILAQDRAERLKDAILNADVPCTGTGRTFYVSNDGSDSRSGRSPRAAFKSLDKVNSMELHEGDVVLFRRGDLWRGQIKTQDGVTYSAYGTGEKPKLYGSPFNAAVTGEWTLTDAPDVYAFSIPVRDDVGLLVFDEGERGCAFKVMQIMYPNGKGFHVETKEPFDGYKDLKRDLDFFHDHSDGVIYLKCKEGNPAKVYKSIELNIRRHGFAVFGPSVKIDNFCIKYVGSHGIGAGTMKNLEVTNCEIGWIGGSIQFCDELKDQPVLPVRFGNGIEIWGGCERFYVDHNYIYEVYDAAMTHQFNGGDDPIVMKDITYTDNVIERCVYGLEYFLQAPDSGDADRTITNMLVKGNVIRDTGMGWGRQRPDKGTPAAIKSWHHTNKSTSCEICDNIFDHGSPSLVNISAEKDEWLPLCRRNIYIMSEGAVLGDTPEKAPAIFR